MENPIHIHAGSYADCFYIPDENVVLYRQRIGTFGGKDYSLTDKREILDEARAIEKNEPLGKANIAFSNVKEFEYDDSKIKELISNAESKSELEKKVQSGIEDLLGEVGKD